MELSKESKVEYLKAQREAIIKQSFQQEIALKLQEKRLSSSKDRGEYADVATIEEEIKALKKTAEGNQEYLSVIDEIEKGL